ncbi:MAG: hypothetical protein ABIR83_11725 [Nakamurella sp.]
MAVSMDVVVHIGTEKTGTTTLQAMLHRNRERLMAAGFYFVQSPGTHNNRNLPVYCLRQRRIDDHCRAQLVDNVEDKIAFQHHIRTRFDEEIAQLPGWVHTVLISSEHFHSRLLHDDEVGNLQSLLTPHFERITILAYLREQASTAVSAFSTHLTTGGVGRLPLFVREYCTPESSYYNYQEFLGRWSRVFGRADMIVRLFDPAEFVNGDLVDDFLSVLDPALIGTLDTGVRPLNESVGQFGQSLLNAVNRHVPRFIDGVGYDPANVALTELVVRGTTGPGATLDEDTRRAVRDDFRDSNEAVRQEYFPDRDALFAERPSAVGRAGGAGVAEMSPENEQVLDTIIETLARGAIPPYYAQLLTGLATTLAPKDPRTARQLLQLARYLGPVDPDVEARLASWDPRSYGRREWTGSTTASRRHRTSR